MFTTSTCNIQCVESQLAHLILLFLLERTIVSRDAHDKLYWLKCETVIAKKNKAMIPLSPGRHELGVDIEKHFKEHYHRP